MGMVNQYPHTTTFVPFYMGAVLRSVFGPMTEEVTEWRKLHNEELHNLHSLSYYQGDHIREG
jgi:hypothetical protein